MSFEKIGSKIGNCLDNFIDSIKHFFWLMFVYDTPKWRKEINDINHNFYNKMKEYDPKHSGYYDIIERYTRK